MHNLFPLPLTAFERYMVQASWHGDPMLSDCTWHFAGTWHRASFEQALRRALLLNPLFRCRIQWTKGRSPRWVLTDRPDVDVFWDAPAAPARWNDDFELTKELGVRIWVGSLGGGRSILSIRYHHAVSDAIGILRFFSDLIHTYALLRSPPGVAKTEWANPNPECLKLRGSIAPELGWLARARAGLHMLRVGNLPATPLAVPSMRAPQPWIAGELASDNLSSAVLTQLRAHAHARGVSFSDYLLATLFRTLTVWNSRRGRPRSADRMRVTMPISTRDQRHVQMSAANCIGVAIIDRSPRECVDRDALLPGIARDIHERHAAVAFADIFAFNDALARLRRKFARHKRTARSSRCVTTAIFAYLGDIERYLPQGGARDEHGCRVFGDVTLLSQFGHPPRQDLTRVALSVNSYRGELSICVNADATYFDRAQAMDFIALYKSQLVAGVALDRADSEALPALSAE
jgi:hypothetical protein